MAMNIEVKKGEEKAVSVQYADTDDGSPPDLSSATMSFVAKADRDDTTAAFSKEHADFDMTNAATGLVLFTLDNADTATAGTFAGEVTATFSATSLDRTKTLTIWIEESVA